MPAFTATFGSVSFFSHLFNPDASSFSCFLNHTKLSNLYSKPSLFKRSPSPSSSLCNLKVSASSASSNTKTDNFQQPEAAVTVVLDNSVPTDDIKPARAARAYLHSGFIYGGRVEGFNGGGLLIRFYSLVGFLPFPLMSPSHSCKEPSKTIHQIAKGLVGSILSVKVIQAEEESRKLIFSEKEAVWTKFSTRINVGDIFEGKVGSVEDYGSFVHLRFPDGVYYLTGLVHVSEVSWDLVQDVRDILTEGDDVRVKVINIDWAKSRITLSIKQLEEDPLLETLDKVIPQDGSADFDSLTASNNSTIEPLPGLDVIFKELLQENGINDVRITRQGFEKRAVSQDLQLWLSNAPPSDNMFTLLARAGRQVQEIQLATSLDQEGIKKALQRVLERVP
ncbi:Nucleic acid-binding proteins superfamily isoform 3 [Hibiscus syriacus]|uniref:Nucleic acid-binding proteins superfamily isoform 3 n=1 Tax=Hibiscus syriacus TaxID=106335 RepID=A0A6A3C9R1_HIBSY|nr:Nucleic acid-binding proteins superfamily isoform 3 [Hibiscus syriacus]